MGVWINRWAGLAHAHETYIPRRFFLKTLSFVCRPSTEMIGREHAPNQHTHTLAHFLARREEPRQHRRWMCVTNSCAPFVMARAKVLVILGPVKIKSKQQPFVAFEPIVGATQAFSSQQLYRESPACEAQQQ